MLTKKFSKTYDEVLTQAYLFHSEFVLDLALFTAFSPSFNVAFAADFLDLIEVADAIPTNQEDLNNQVIFSTAVEEQMVVARAVYQELLVYIGLAFPNSESALLAFGNNMYEKARYSPQKMVNLLQLAYRNASSATYKVTLIAEGFLQVDIDSLDTIQTELNERYNDQQEFMKHTYGRTEERTVAFNAVWDVMVKINAASKIVFKDSPAKIEYYLLYQASTPIGNLTAPANFAFEPIMLNLTWGAVENATSYEIQSSPDGTNYTQYWAGIATDCNLFELPTILMYYRVRARNAGGYGPFSVVLSYDFTVPMVAPTNLAYDPARTELTWTQVPAAQSYQLHWKHTDQIPWTVEEAGTGNSHGFLRPAGDYLAKIRALRYFEIGPFSDELELTIT